MLRVDHKIIAGMLHNNAKILDIGCGEGELLEHLTSTKNIEGRGLELSRQGVNGAVARGLAVIQGDADTDLDAYPDNFFDCVILSQTLQATHNPKDVLENMLRIGTRAIVSIPNFAHWRLRLHVLFKGKMPVSKTLPYTWYNTPNIHLCSIGDFVSLLEELDIKIVEAVALKSRNRPFGVKAPWFVWNLIGEQAIFLLEKRKI